MVSHVALTFCFDYCCEFYQGAVTYSATHATLTFLNQLILHTFAATRITHTFQTTHVLTYIFAATHVSNICLYDIYPYLQLPLWATVPLRLDVSKDRRSDRIMNQPNCGLILCKLLGPYNARLLSNVIAWGFFIVMSVDHGG